MDPSARIFKDISEKSYYEILVWLQKAAVIYPEKIFIYRRHPAERYSKEILEIEKKVSNFRCIDQSGNGSECVTNYIHGSAHR